MADHLQRNSFDLHAAVAKLTHAEEGIRLAAVGEILAANASAQALDVLATCLDDPSGRVRRAAVVALSEVGGEAALVLARALDEKQPTAIRILAASGLARASAAPATDALLKCLSSEVGELELRAALALGKIGAPAVPALRKALASTDDNVRAAAADALGYTGPAGIDALDDLKRAVTAAPAFALGFRYAAAIVKISENPKVGLPVLIDLLKDKDENIRLRVLEKIGELRSLAREAAPWLINLLNDPAAGVRGGAALGLGRIGANSPDVIVALIRALSDSAAEVRTNAAIALTAFGGAAASALPRLRAMQHDGDAWAGAVAGAAIERIAGGKE